MQLSAQVRATREHLDSKKLAVIDFVRAKRTQLAASYGHDPITTFTAFAYTPGLTMLGSSAALCCARLMGISRLRHA